MTGAEARKKRRRAGVVLFQDLNLLPRGRRIRSICTVADSVLYQQCTHAGTHVCLSCCADTELVVSSSIVEEVSVFRSHNMFSTGAPSFLESASQRLFRRRNILLDSGRSTPFTTSVAGHCFYCLSLHMAKQHDQSPPQRPPFHENSACAFVYLW